MRQHFLLYPSYFTFAELEAQWLPLNLYPRQRTERNERRDALLSLCTEDLFCPSAPFHYHVIYMP